MNYTIMQGDNRDTLKTLEDNSVDAIVTDPPYGIDFLGKNWDSNTGAIETYQECLRVLKPGGHILAFSAARTYHHLAITLEQAGFEVRDQLMWLYSSGFPKAQDIGRGIQKRKGVEKTKPLVANGPANGMARMTFNQSEPEKYAQTKTAEDIVLTDSEAQQWQGWKTALKPAHEPICMARKPFKGSCIDNVQEHGTGALNIDASRFEERYPSNVIGEVEGYQKFFYCPKVNRKERHCGFDLSGVKTNPEGMYERKNEIGDGHARIMDNGGNNHPTVKPVALMTYLINLITPPNSTVLDPFCGSGSTGMAAVKQGHIFIGCELDPAYVDIANKRIAAWNTSATAFNELFEEQK